MGKTFSSLSTAGTGIITKTELKCFYTAFLDVGKLGEQKILEITDSAFEALTSVGKSCNSTSIVFDFCSRISGMQLECNWECCHWLCVAGQLGNVGRCSRQHQIHFVFRLSLSSIKCLECIISNSEMGKITCKRIFIKDQDQLCQRSKIKIKDHFSRNDLRSKIRSFQKITYYINMDVVWGSCRNYAVM